VERFFKVTAESPLYHDYMAYIRNAHEVNELVKAFMDKHGIETSLYIPYNEKLYIQPTKADTEKFDAMLCKPETGNVRAFKKNSLVGKDWITSLKERNLKILHKPFVPLYFPHRGGGHYQTRLFQIDGVVYCSIAGGFRQLDTPKGMVKIKASEFFRIIEEHEEKSQKTGGEANV